jgi:hypothetical protein
MTSDARRFGGLRRWARPLGRALLLIAGCFSLYVLLLLHPGPHRAVRAAQVLHLNRRPVWRLHAADAP